MTTTELTNYHSSMLRNKSLVVLAHFFITILIFGCSNKYDVKLYVDYVNDSSNGLIKEVQFDQYYFTVQYRPTEMLIIQDMSIIKNVDPLQLRAKYNNSFQFVLNIKGLKERSSSIESSNTRGLNMEQYFNFDFQKDLKLLVESDSLECRLFHREPYNSLMDMSAFILVFEKPKCSDCDITLIYDGNQFNNERPLYFNFDGKDIENIPKIQI